MLFHLYIYLHSHTHLCTQFIIIIIILQRKFLPFEKLLGSLRML